MADTDQPIEQVLETMHLVMAFGLDAYLRWTCPKCQERVLADQPNVYHATGYRHTARADGTPCGGVYQDRLFGLAVAVPDMPPEELDERLRRLPPDVVDGLKVIRNPPLTPPG